MGKLKCKYKYCFKVALISSLVTVAHILTLNNVSAQIVINEFSPVNSSDWIELYNIGTESAKLEDYIIRDSTSNKKEPEGVLEVGQLMSLSFSNWLNNGGDTVKLLKKVEGYEVIVEEIKYGDSDESDEICIPTGGKSIGRKPDGSGSFVVFSTDTRDSSNNSSQEVQCIDPTPTPVPTATPKPTGTPITSKSSNTETKKASPKPSSTVINASLGPSVTPSNNEDEKVLGISEKTSADSNPKTSPDSDSESTGSGSLDNFPVGILFIFGGILLSSAAAYVAYIQTKRQGFNLTDIMKR